jgi:hypothetical protein
VYTYHPHPFLHTNARAQHDTALSLLMQHLAKVKLEKEEEAYALSSQIKAVNHSLKESIARQQELEDELVRVLACLVACLVLGCVCRGFCVDG